MNEMHRRRGDEIEETGIWWKHVPVSSDGHPESLSDEIWLFDDPIPDLASLVKVENGEEANRQFFTLCTFQDWSDKRAFGEKLYANAKRHAWVHVRSYLIDRDRRDEAVDALQHVRLWGHGLDVPHELGGWIGEYPKGAWKRIGESCSNDLDRWPSTIELPLTLTSCEYYNEYDSPSFSAYLPSPPMLSVLSADWSADFFRFTGKAGDLVCFDPASEMGGPNAFLADVSALNKALEANSLSLIWTIVGERSMLGGPPNVWSGQRDFSAVYWLEDDVITGGTTIVVEQRPGGKETVIQGVIRSSGQAVCQNLVTPDQA